MATSDTTALVLAGAANAVGAAVAIGMWRRHRRRQRVLGSHHPSGRPPLTVGLVDTPAGRRIRIGVPRGAPEVAIDIVSFRRQDPPGAWDGEPLEEPLLISPGGEAELGSVLDDDADVVDVVVAWTAHHATGDVQGSRLFRIPPEREDPAPPPRPLAGVSGRAALVLMALLVASGVLVALSSFDDEPAGDALSTPPTSGAPTSSIAPTTVVAPADPSTTTPSAVAAPATAPPATAAPGTAAPATTTSRQSTAVSDPTTTAVTTSTVPPTTTTSAATTTPSDDGPQVRITGRVAPCQFADECLVADFTLAGFDPETQEYVCEFEDGSRFTFRFLGDGAREACATGSPSGSITIEVAGVRSDTVTWP